jgi:hypothetical protein
MAQKAGLVWNSETNQMAVALMKGDVTEVFAERIQAAAQERVARAEDAARDKVDETVQGAVAGVIPAWPAEMSWVNPREAIGEAVEQRVEQAVEQAQTQAVEAAAPRSDDSTPGDPANDEAYEAPQEDAIDDEDEADSEVAPAPEAAAP